MCHLQKLQFCYPFGGFEANHWFLSGIGRDQELTAVELRWWFQQHYSCFRSHKHTVICMKDSQPFYCIKGLWIHIYSILRIVFNSLMSRRFLWINKTCFSIRILINFSSTGVSDFNKCMGARVFWSENILHWVKEIVFVEKNDQSFVKNFLKTLLKEPRNPKGR